MRKKIVKKFGEILIKGAERYGTTSCSQLFGMHEVERPECLKRLDRERLQEENKKVK